MRRLLSFVVVAVFCSMVMPFTASAQIDLGKALGALLGSSQPQQTTVSHYDVIRDNAPAKSKILGTWQYKSASLEYLGVNPLADVALAQIEGFGISELKNRGVVEGCCSLTLRRNGMAVLATRDTLLDCMLSYNEADATVDVSTTVDGVTYKAKGYIRIISDALVVLLDAHDVMDIIAKGNPSITSDQMFITAKEVVRSFGEDVYLAVNFVR